jgi:MoaA/NifB/PqqE/SkfB family radical SAM enzyme
MSEKNSFCIYPWIHMQLKPNGQAKPCCRFDHMNDAYVDENGEHIMPQYNVKNMNLDEIMKSEFWTRLRQDMLRNKRIPGCYKCDKEDAKGSYSMRFNANHAWNKQNEYRPIKDNTQLDFRYLELTTGRYCNQACRMCSSDLSTYWDDDDKILEKHYSDRKDYSKRPQTLDLNFNENDFGKTSLIKLTGGEPMISPTFIPFVDKVLSSGQAGNILIQIYTNCSWVPKSKIIDRLKQFGIVQIFLSIDGIDKVNDYIRYPSKWATVEESAKKWIEISKEYRNFDIVFSPTISLYNVLQLIDMWKWWENLQLETFGEKFIVDHNLYKMYLADKDIKGDTSYIYEVARFSPTILHTPTYLSPTQLPDKSSIIDGLKIVIEKYKDIAANKTEQEYLQRFNYTIKHLISSIDKPSNNELQTFTEYSLDLDKIRNQDIKEHIPNLWNQIKNLVIEKTRI